MTTLMSKNPETGTKQTLNNGVDSPQQSANWGPGNVFWGKVFVEEEESSGQTGNIASNISQTSGSRAFVAVLRNCVSNIIDGIIWKLEFVSIGIDELAIWFVLLDIIA